MGWIIYKHTNLINGKVYIGQTKQDPKARWQNGGGYRNNRHFTNAIKFYGWNNFKHDVLEKNIETQKEANEREIFYIKKYDSFYHGYNLSLGGDNHEHQGKTIYQINMKTLKIVNKYPTIASANKVFKPNNQTSQITECINKHRISAYGFYWCDQDSLDSFEPLRKKYFNSRKVYCLETGKEYATIQDASLETNINRKCISACCSYKAKSAGGFHFCFVEDKNNYKIRKKDVSKNNAKGIKCIETGKVYQSLKQASIETQISVGNISQALTGRNKTAGGFHWKYN